MANRFSIADLKSLCKMGKWNECNDLSPVFVH